MENDTQLKQHIDNFYRNATVMGAMTIVAQIYVLAAGPSDLFSFFLGTMMMAIAGAYLVSAVLRHLHGNLVGETGPAFAWLLVIFWFVNATFQYGQAAFA